MLKKTIGLFRDAWRVTGPFWTSPQGREEKGTSRAMAYLILGTIIAMSFGQVYLSVALNTWRGDFYDGLQNYTTTTDPAEATSLESATWVGIGTFSKLAFCYIFTFAYSRYLRQLLSIRWRTWLLHRYMNFYLAGNAFYHWNTIGKPTDNPDQRLTEDVRDFIDNTMSLTLDALQQVTSLISFSVILYGMSAPVYLWGVEYHGVLMWSAYLYAFIGTLCVHGVGRKLALLMNKQQRVEADYRFSLIRMRENAESIALSKGAPAENHYLRGRFGRVIENFINIMVTTKQVNLVGGIYGQGANIFPIMLLLPAFFLKKIKLGGMFKAAEAFGNVLDALSFFVTSYGTLAQWSAITTRLVGFLDTAEEAHRMGPTIADHVNPDGPGKAIVISNVALALPDGKPLREGINLTFSPGQATLISGPSGSGKSTLVRATSGLWPYMQGNISLPAGATTMVLPQRPYLPVDTLAAALAYPVSPLQFDPKVMTDFLTLLRLGHFAHRLEESANWALIVSGGEAQRIAVIRALLQKPNWLFLDEATSALDEDLQTIVYQTLKAQLPNTTIISVGHRETLEAFHQQRYDFVTGNSTRLPT